MNDFFTSIYSWFCDPSLGVFKIINAIHNDDDDLVLSSSFPTIGITAAVIAIAIAVAFYIWPINHPRFKAWWAWLIMLLTNALINFGLAFAFIQHRISDCEGDSEAFYIACQWLNIEDPETLSSKLSGQWFDLALSNAFVSMMFFAVASLIFNWFSTNCRFSPFRK